VAKKVLPGVDVELVDVRCFTCRPEPVGFGIHDTLTWTSVAARRSYILITGRFRRVWFVKFISEKIKSIISNSEACMKCKCNFTIDAVDRETFFWYVIIDGEKRQDVETCDLYIFGEIFKELETLEVKHHVSSLSYPLGHLILLK